MIDRLQVSHPADDDNLRFITFRGRSIEAQIETRTDGPPLFLIEGPGTRQRRPTPPSRRHDLGVSGPVSHTLAQRAHVLRTMGSSILCGMGG